jgi:hypothetical protein
MKKIAIGCAAFFLVIGLIGIFGKSSKPTPADHFVYVDHGGSPPVDPPAPAKPAPAPLTDDQKKIVDDLIPKLQSEDVFGDLKLRGDAVFAIVGLKWYALSFEDKTNFSNVLIGWGKTTNINTNTVIYNDFRTNKEAGTFGAFGLKVD